MVSLLNFTMRIQPGRTCNLKHLTRLQYLNNLGVSLPCRIFKNTPITPVFHSEFTVVDLKRYEFICGNGLFIYLYVFRIRVGINSFVIIFWAVFKVATQVSRQRNAISTYLHTQSLARIPLFTLKTIVVVAVLIS